VNARTVSSLQTLVEKLEAFAGNRANENIEEKKAGKK